MHEYAAIAQAVYRHGGWTGSFGLKSKIVKARSQRAATLKAKRFYMREWKKHREPGWKLSRLHVSVVAL